MMAHYYCSQEYTYLILFLQDMQEPQHTGQQVQIQQMGNDALTHNNYQLAEEHADQLFSLKSYLPAIKIYQRIIEANPEMDYRIEGLGNSEEQIGYYEWDRYAWYSEEKMNKKFKGSPYDALSLCCLSHNKYEQGIAWYKEMAERYPKNYQIIFGYANILYNNSIYEQALNYYEFAYKLNPKFVKPLVDIALLYEYRRVNKRRSTQKAKEVLSLDPNNQYALFILARNQNDVDKKIQQLHTAWQYNVRYTRVCNEIGIAYGGTKKNYAEAIVWYTKCTEISPQYSSCYNNIGVNNELLKRFQQAQKWYFKAVLSDPQYKTAYKNLKDVFDQLKFSDDKIIQQSKKYNVNESLFCFYVGLSYYDKQKINKSIKWIEKAIVLNPNEYRFYNSLAISYNQNKNYDKAILNYKKCIQSNPKYYSAYYNLAIVYKSLNRENQAINWYIKATEVNPRYSYAYNNLGNIYKKNQKYSQAIYYYEKAIQFNSTYTLAYINMGVCHLNLQQYKEASQVFQSAQEIVNTDNNLSQSNKEFIRPHLQRYEFQGYKWRKFTSISQASKEKLRDITELFEGSLNDGQSKLKLQSSIYKSEELFTILSLLVKSKWELDSFGEILIAVRRLYTQDKNLFYLIPWVLYQFFLRKKLVQKLPYQDIEIEIQNILSKQIQFQIMHLQLGQELTSHQEWIKGQLSKLSSQTIVDQNAFNLFEQISYFTACEHLFSQLLHVNNRAVSQIESFKQFIEAVKEKVNKDCKFTVNLRIPDQREHQFGALLSILQEMFKNEVGDEVKFQITAKINESLNSQKELQSTTILKSLYKTWVQQLTTMFLKERIKDNEQTYCFITDFVEAICLFESVKEIISAVKTIYVEKDHFGFEVLQVKNQLFEKGENSVQVIVKKKNSVFKIRLQLQKIHESVSFFREAKKIEISPFGSIFACLLACSKGKDCSLSAVSQNLTNILQDHSNQSIQNLERQL